jgi:hypothetical protein
LFCLEGAISKTLLWLRRGCWQAVSRSRRSLSREIFEIRFRICGRSTLSLLKETPIGRRWKRSRGKPATIFAKERQNVLQQD